MVEGETYRTPVNTGFREVKIVSASILGSDSVLVGSLFVTTVKPVLRCHFKIDNTKVLIQNGSLMKVESIAKCSLWSILQYF